MVGGATPTTYSNLELAHISHAPVLVRGLFLFWWGDDAPLPFPLTGAVTSILYAWQLYPWAKGHVPPSST